MSNRAHFAVVVSGPSRLAFAGSAETVAALVPVHAPRSILPGEWNGPADEDFTYRFYDDFKARTEA